MRGLTAERATFPPRQPQILRAMFVQYSIPAGALILCLPLLAQAQQSSSARDPAIPHSPTPGLTYRSAFEGYRPWQDLPRVDWRAANDKVRGAPAAGAEPASPAPGRAMPMPHHGAGHAPGRMK